MENQATLSASSEMPLASSVRYPLVDYIRGIAVILMIIFHFTYDLQLFGYVKLDFTSHHSFWYLLPRVIVFLFLLAVGSSMVIVHTPHIRWSKFGKRLLELSGLAMLISLVTYWLFPERWIYFGTLHCIALCSVLALPFLHRPRLAGGLGLALILPALIWGKSLPWIVLGHLSMDYIPPFPWLGVVLLGIFATHQQWHQYMSRSLQYLHWLEWMGKRSLSIYLLHQPLLFAALWVLNWFTDAPRP